MRKFQLLFWRSDKYFSIKYGQFLSTNEKLIKNHNLYRLNYKYIKEIIRMNVQASNKNLKMSSNLMIQLLWTAPLYL